jgi:catechol 2,3-dioxygenase-like lactoylglutathione lyase family enzyme
LYRFGDVQLNLHGPGGEYEPSAKIPVPAGGSVLCFEWRGEIGEAVEHLKRHEVELGPIVRFGARGEGISVYLRDPDGSLLEFVSYASGAR